MRYDKVLFKVATKYKYIGDKEIHKPGQIFQKSSTLGYEDIEGIEFTLEEAGRLFIAVDDMLYDISNQWEDGMNIEDFIKEVRDVMVGIVL